MSTDRAVGFRRRNRIAFLFSPLLLALLVTPGTQDIARAAPPLFGTPLMNSYLDDMDVRSVDVDGDGDPELAVVGSAPGLYKESQWVIHAGAHAWPNPPIFPDRVTFAFGDLNHDGRPDFVGNIGYDGVLAIHLRNSDGTIAPATHVSVGVAALPSSTAIADVDGDGHPDVVLGFDQGQYSFLRGRGDGTLHAGVHEFRGGRMSPCVLEDFNGDGHADLAVPGAILLEQGAGRFGPRLTYAPEGLFCVADFNTDGFADIATVPDGARELGILLGHGDGSFESAERHSFQIPPSALAAGDLDRDGRVDVVVGDAEGTVSVLRGNGDGALGPAAQFSAGGAVTSIAMVDLNRDERLDVVVAGAAMTALTGNGDGTLDGVESRAHGVGRGPEALVIDDFDGDGRPDVVTANAPSATLSLLRGRSGGGFAPSEELEASGRPSGLATADLNVDGVADLLVLDSALEMLSSRLGNGDGTFRDPLRGPGGVLEWVAVRDMNVDGIPDLVVRLRALGVSIAIGAGDGTFGPPLPIGGAPEGRSPNRVARVAEMNGDGRPDLLAVGDGEEDLLLWSGLASEDGSFTWTRLASWPSYAGWGTSITSLLTGPLDEDYLDDVAMAFAEDHGSVDPTTYRIGTLLAAAPRGANFLFPGGHGRGAPSPSVQSMTSADFDGDGRLDLALTRGGRNGVTVVRNVGETSLAGEGEFFGGDQAGAVASADLNDDGRPDLVVVDAGRNEVRVLLNQSDRRAPPPAPREVRALSGEASILVKWKPPLQDVAGYRIFYGVAGTDPRLEGNFATEGPSGIPVPATTTSLVLHCVTGSPVAVAVRAVGADGREGSASHVVVARPQHLGADAAMWSPTLNSRAAGGWVKMTMELHAGYDAANIVPESVRLNQQIAGEPVGLADRDHDSIQELQMRFPRVAVEKALGPGRPALVNLTGVVRGCREEIPFSAQTTIRVVGPGSAVDHELGPTTEAEAERTPAAFALLSPRPNPAGSECHVAFDLPHGSRVQVEIFDVRGRSVARLMDSELPAGRHVVPWKTERASVGLYFVRMSAGAFQDIRRIVVSR